jgi:ubiquinone/menaquinone biosynthesis C-methylase UbiE
MRIRRAYYDLFSHVYDRVIAMHSGDANAAARDFLVERTGVEAGGQVLDLCTGTGAVALSAQQAVGPGGFVVGLDFSGVGRADSNLPLPHTMTILPSSAYRCGTAVLWQ